MWAIKLISVVTHCYNEESSIRDVYEPVRRIFSELDSYDYEHIFIDNASKDGTVSILRELARADKPVRVILNTRNSGTIRSPYHAVLQSRSDAVTSLVADLQDQPAVIVDFVRKWEEGYKVAVGVKDRSEESALMFALRKLYYRTLCRLSDVELVEQFTGFGLYDRQVENSFGSIGDSYPYFRGLIADIGFETAKIEYVQPARRRGSTKHNFRTLHDTTSW